MNAKVLAVGAQKGGVGKTASAIYLAARAAELFGGTAARHVVGLVDRDESENLTALVIAGSRRLLAARLVHGDPEEALRARAALVPCIVKEATDGDSFADALLENLARADLSRAETMDALLRLQRDFGWSGKYIARRTGRSQGDISELLSIAADGDLADLVRKDAVKPSTATVIKRLPRAVREAAIADLQAGKSLTIDEARRRLRTARVPAQPPPVQGPPYDTAAGVSNSIPPAPSTHDREVAEIHPAAGVSNSIPSNADASTTDATLADGRALPAAGTEGALQADVLAGVREQLEAIGALAAMVDGQTLAGAAVLAAVTRDLDTAYERLAVHLKRRKGRDEA